MLPQLEYIQNWHYLWILNEMHVKNERHRWNQLLFWAQCRYTEIAQRMFKHSDIQYTTVTPDKILISLVYRMLFYVNTYRSFKLSKNSPFFLAHPVLSVTLSNLNRRSHFYIAGKCMKFATKPIRHYPPHLRRVAILPWEIKNSNFWPPVNCACVLLRF